MGAGCFQAPGCSGRVRLDVFQPSASDSHAPPWLQTEDVGLDVPLPEREQEKKKYR